MAMDGGGQTLSELYNSSKRLSMKTRDALERLERLEYAPSSSILSSNAVVSSSSDDQAAAIRKEIVQIQSFCSEMDRLWRSIASRPQRDLWKRKVEQVSEEAESFRASLDKYVSRHQKRIQEAQERAELLGRASGDSHVLRIFDDERQAQDSVRRSSKLLEDTFQAGIDILSKYSEQRDHLKRAQRKALDVLNTLGLSNSLLRIIKRQNCFDRWIKVCRHAHYHRHLDCFLEMDKMTNVSLIVLVKFKAAIDHTYNWLLLLLTSSYILVECYKKVEEVQKGLMTNIL